MKNDDGLEETEEDGSDLDRLERLGQSLATQPEDLFPGGFGTVLADPPWRFANRTGKVAPEHRRLVRYRTMSLTEIGELPVADLVLTPSHLCLWVPNALLPGGLERPGHGLR